MATTDPRDRGASAVKKEGFSAAAKDRAAHLAKYAVPPRCSTVYAPGNPVTKVPIPRVPPRIRIASLATQSVLKIADLLPARKVSATWSLAACLLVLAAGLTSCTYSEPSSAVGSATVPPSPASTADSESPLGGEIHADSFGNVDFYTTVSGDTLANDAGMYKLSEEKVAEFNGLQPGAPLTPGTKLRLVPEGPILGAKGAVTTDANGIPTSYVIEPEDTLGGITYRFNLTHEQLAEANKVPFTYEKGGAYFNQAGDTIQLQKNPVDARKAVDVALQHLDAARQVLALLDTAD